MASDGRRFEGQTIVWAGGVRVNPLLASIDLRRGPDGRIVVDRSFRADGRSDVVAFGDAAYFEQDGRALPQLAQVAVLQAPAVARNLVRLVRDQAPLPYRHHAKGDLIALGRTNAGAQMRRVAGVPTGNVVFGGVPAWTVWRVNYLTQLLGVRNRASLLTEWTLSLFFSRMVANTP